ncbi:hypothetical protein [Massilia sp. PWRC2]|uniref:hypothetical protein n=1 Tax=Massilia sp. PWRC2 TaxID=2804626 RepID=UPI003CF9BE35
MCEALLENSDIAIIALVYIAVLAAFIHNLFRINQKARRRRAAYEAGRRQSDGRLVKDFG